MEARHIVGALSGLITLSFILPWASVPYGGSVSPIMLLDMMNGSSGYPIGLIIFLLSFPLAGVTAVTAFFSEELPQELVAAAGIVPLALLLYVLAAINGQRDGSTIFGMMSGQLSIGVFAYGVPAVVLSGIAFLHPELNGERATKSPNGGSSATDGRMEPRAGQRDGDVIKRHLNREIQVDGSWYRVGRRKFPTIELAEGHINEEVAREKAKTAAEEAAKAEAEAPPGAQVLVEPKNYKGRVIEVEVRRFFSGAASASTEPAIRRYIDQIESWMSKRGEVSPEQSARIQKDLEVWAEGLSEKRARLPDGGLVAVWRDFPITRGPGGFVANEISLSAAQDARIYIDAMIDG